MAKHIELRDKRGQALLLKSQNKSQCRDNLNKTIKRQRTEYTCGIASLSSVLNDWYLTESNANVDDDSKWPFSEQFLTPKLYDMNFGDEKNGITLDSLVLLIGTLFPHSVTVDVKRLSDSIAIDEFRHDIRKCLTASSQTAIIVNYLMCSICPDWLPCGHFSPISAYDEETDHLLVADTYMPSYWVDTESMFRAIDTFDPQGNKKRGYLLLSCHGKIFADNPH